MKTQEENNVPNLDTQAFPANENISAPDAASTAESGERQFSADTDEAVKDLASRSERWMSKMSRLFGGGEVRYPKNEIQQEQTSPASSFSSNVRNTFDKGLDAVVEKATWFRDGGFEVDPQAFFKKMGERFNKANETFATGAYNVVAEGGYKAVNGFRDTVLESVEKISTWMRRRAEEKKQISMGRAELMDSVEILRTEKDPSLLEKAKTAIMSQFKKTMDFGDISLAVANYRGKAAHDDYIQNMLAHQMQAVALQTGGQISESGPSHHEADKSIKQKYDFLQQFNSQVALAHGGGHSVHEGGHGGGH